MEVLRLCRKVPRDEASSRGARWLLAALLCCGVPTLATGSAASPILPDGSNESVWDVVVDSDGRLHGRVLAPRTAASPGPPAGISVNLLRDGQAIAAATTDVDGRFAVDVPSAGLYRVVVQRGGASSQRTCRLWTPTAAPPRTPREILLPLGNPPARTLVRGQRGPSPFPITSLEQAATVTGLAVGAIAAPMIYHNTLQDNRVPVSP